MKLKKIANLIKNKYKYNFWKIIKVVFFTSKKVLNAHLIKTINNFLSIKKLNVGSGERAWIGWDNLDELDFPTVKKIHFSEHTKFPKKNKKYNLIYSSHFLEHIDDSTINNLLEEINKNLSNNGAFILKVPAFEEILHSYRKFKDRKKIEDEHGIILCDKIIWSWKNFGVQDTIENRISCLFIGYWNNAYGNHYPRIKRNVSNLSYHGPARLPHSELRELLLNAEIKDIKNKLLNVSLQDPDFKAFNHCNIWSKSDLENRLIDKGFKIESSNKDSIKKEYENLIPDFKNMFSWSHIIKATKV